MKFKDSFIFNELKLKNSLMPIGVACILAYIAKLSFGTVMGGAIDDFFLVAERFHFDYSFYLSQGRWGVAIISKLLEPLNLDYVAGKNLFGILYALQIAFAMLVLMRFLKIKTNKYIELLVLGVATLHPYLCEIFTYRHATMVNTLSFSYPSMAVGYILLYHKKYRFFGVSLIVWALSGYQVVLSMVLVFVPIQILHMLLQGQNPRKVVGKMLIPVSLLIGSVIVYMLISKLIMGLTQTPPSPRSEFIGLENINNRFIQLTELLNRVFMRNESIALIIPKLILLGTLLGSLGLAIISPSSSKKSNWGKILFIPLILLSAVCIIGPPILLKVWWSTPRVMSNIGFFWALALLLFLNQLGETRQKYMYLPLGFVLLSFIYTNNRIQADQQRINFLDFNKSNRIIAQLEEIDSFQDKRILFLRQNDGMYAIGASTEHMDLNISTFLPEWSQLSMLEYASGYDFKRATAEDRKIILEKFPLRPSFPKKGSIFEYKEILVIQL